MSEIARQNDLSRYTLRLIKALLSGVFKYAKRLGTMEGVNPVQDVSIPKARPGIETYAYSLEEIIRMISVLGQPAATVVATAAFTGMRKGELRAFFGRITTRVQSGSASPSGRALLMNRRPRRVNRRYE